MTLKTRQLSFSYDNIRLQPASKAHKDTQNRVNFGSSRIHTVVNSSFLIRNEPHFEEYFTLYDFDFFGIILWEAESGELKVTDDRPV